MKIPIRITMPRIQVLLPIIVLAIASCTAWAMQTGSTLTMNGKVISTDIQIVKGHAYVPLNDVASILGMTVVRKGQAYRLARAGASHPIHSLTGKLADNISSGVWQFQVAGIQHVSAYSQQYGTEKAQFAPKEDGDTLVVVRCRVKNETKEMQEVSFDSGSAGNTALIDSQENGYVPLAYDSRDSDYMADKMRSGSVHEFSIIFSVPKGATLKHLIYTVASSGLDNSTDFSVSL